MIKPKVTALTRQELYRRVWAKPLSAVAKELGLSGPALAKICNRLLVPYPHRGHWAKVNAGKLSVRPRLPAAPETSAQQVTISSARSASRRSRTRLDPSARREQLLEMARRIVSGEGLHAASMKRIAAAGGISETQAYNYFGSRDKLFIELARREYAQVLENRQKEIDRGHDHYSRVRAATVSYLRQLDERGGLLQMLLSSPDVREALRNDLLKRNKTALPAHAQRLIELFGLPRDIAIGCTAILSRIGLQAGQLVADKSIGLTEAERLNLAIVLQGSHSVVLTYGKSAVRGAKSLKAA